MNTTATMQPAQPVLVKKVVKVKRKRSLVELLITTIVILSVFIVVGAFFSVTVWLHTYKVYTQEKVVAELRVSKKVIKDGKPTFSVTYTPIADVSGLWGFLGSSSKTAGKEIEIELVGDQVFVSADYVRWQDWLTFINMKPLYKVDRISTGFQKTSDYKSINVDAIDVNGGRDWFAGSLQSNPDALGWMAQSVFISSAGVNVSNDEVSYRVISTEDALVLEKM